MHPRLCALPLAFALALTAACADTGPGPAGPPDDDPFDPDGAPTWSEDLAPIVYENCVGCHQEGGIAPFSLLDYDIAVALGPLMARVTEERTMPPMPVDNSGDCNTYDNARWLDDDEIAMFRSWVDAGMPEGDPAALPAAPAAPAGIDDPDLIVDMGESYTPDATRADDYRCFVVDPGLDEPAFLTGYEVRPGAPSVVHHLIVFSLEDDAAVTQVEALDAADPDPGYECFGGSGAAGAPLMLWAPGVGATHFPEGTGIRMDGRKVVMQLHYNLATGPVPDRTTVHVRTAPTVSRPAVFEPIKNASMELPPRMEYVESSKDMVVPGSGTFLSYGTLPHMHQLGRTLRVERLEADGSSTCMVDVDRWDFGWQNAWFYDEPIEVRGGDRLRITCGYETTERSDVVRWGDGTDDEMCINYFYVAL